MATTLNTVENNLTVRFIDAIRRGDAKVVKDCIDRNVDLTKYNHGIVVNSNVAALNIVESNVKDALPDLICDRYLLGGFGLPLLDVVFSHPSNPRELFDLIVPAMMKSKINLSSMVNFDEFIRFFMHFSQEKKERLNNLKELFSALVKHGFDLETITVSLQFPVPKERRQFEYETETRMVPLMEFLKAMSKDPNYCRMEIESNRKGGEREQYAQELIDIVSIPKIKQKINLFAPDVSLGELEVAIETSGRSRKGEVTDDLDFIERVANAIGIKVPDVKDRKDNYEKDLLEQCFNSIIKDCERLRKLNVSKEIVEPLEAEAFLNYCRWGDATKLSKDERISILEKLIQKAPSNELRAKAFSELAIIYQTMYFEHSKKGEVIEANSALMKAYICSNRGEQNNDTRDMTSVCLTVLKNVKGLNSETLKILYNDSCKELRLVPINNELEEFNPQEPKQKPPKKQASQPKLKIPQEDTKEAVVFTSFLINRLDEFCDILNKFANESDPKRYSEQVASIQQFMELNRDKIDLDMMGKDKKSPRQIFEALSKEKQKLLQAYFSKPDIQSFEFD